MRSPHFLWFLGLVVGAQGCYLDDGRRAPSGAGGTSATSGTPPSACSESRPQILALDMQPSASIGDAGDYEINGTIRSSCSTVTVEAHVFTPDGYVRWAASPDASSETKLSLRFAASQKGQVVQYDVSTYDALGQESPRLRQSVTLE